MWGLREWIGTLSYSLDVHFLEMGRSTFDCWVRWGSIQENERNLLAWPARAECQGYFQLATKLLLSKWRDKCV